MIKNIHSNVWAFDCEWVPDPDAGRKVYELSDSLSDEEVLDEMWIRGGATEENPRPFLKTALCRVVSISAVIRRRERSAVSLELRSLPTSASSDDVIGEAEIIERFLRGVGKTKPQLVGFNSLASDLLILVQRGIANGVSVAEFCSRPDKPWEGVDYFARNSDWNVDLMEVVGTWGRGNPSLHEIAVVSGIPGKFDVDGSEVAQLFYNDEYQKIIDYNEYDALTTYLLWLRIAFFAGKLDDDEYAQEQEALREMIEEKISSGSEHLKKYLEKWDTLQK